MCLKKTSASLQPRYPGISKPIFNVSFSQNQPPSLDGSGWLVSFSSQLFRSKSSTLADSVFPQWEDDMEISKFFGEKELGFKKRNQGNITKKKKGKHARKLVPRNIYVANFPKKWVQPDSRAIYHSTHTHTHIHKKVEGNERPIFSHVFQEIWQIIFCQKENSKSCLHGWMEK